MEESKREVVKHPKLVTSRARSAVFTLSTRFYALSFSTAGFKTKKFREN